MAQPRVTPRVKQTVIGGASYPTRNLNLLGKLAWAVHYENATQKLAAEFIGEIKDPEVQKYQDTRKSIPIKPVQLTSAGAPQNLTHSEAVAQSLDQQMKPKDYRDAPFLATGSTLSELPDTTVESVNPSRGRDANISIGVRGLDTVTNTRLANTMGAGRVPGRLAATAQYLPALYDIARVGLGTAGIMPMAQPEATLLTDSRPVSLRNLALQRQLIENQLRDVQDPSEKVKLDEQADKLDQQYRDIVHNQAAFPETYAARNAIGRADVGAAGSAAADLASNLASFRLANTQGLGALRQFGTASPVISATMSGLGSLLANSKNPNASQVDPTLATAAGAVSGSVPLWTYMLARRAALSAGTELGGAAAAKALARRAAAPLQIITQAANTIASGVPTEANKNLFDTGLMEQAVADVEAGVPPGGNHPFWRGVAGVLKATYNPANPSLSSTNSLTTPAGAFARYREFYNAALENKYKVDTATGIRQTLANTWGQTMPSAHIEHLTNLMTPYAVEYRFGNRTPEEQKATHQAVGQINQWLQTNKISQNGLKNANQFMKLYGPQAFVATWGTDLSQTNPAIHHRFRSWIEAGK